jgi:hypothetical protein
MARVTDLGDVPLPSVLNPDLATKEAEAFYRRVHELDIVPITVGGDHSITTPILRAIGGEHSPFQVSGADSPSHSGPVRRGDKNYLRPAFGKLALRDLTVPVPQWVGEGLPLLNGRYQFWRTRP